MCWARLSHFELDHHKINSRGQQDHQVILHHNSQMRLWPAPSYLTTNWLDSLTRTILPTNFNTKKFMFEFELLFILFERLPTITHNLQFRIKTKVLTVNWILFQICTISWNYFNLFCIENILNYFFRCCISLSIFIWIKSPFLNFPLHYDDCVCPSLLYQIWSPKNTLNSFSCQKFYSD